MATDWTQKLNEQLDALGLYPDVEACDIVTVYRSAERCYRLLAGVEPSADEHETCDRVGQALHPNLVEGISVREEHGLWRQDPAVNTEDDTLWDPHQEDRDDPPRMV